MAVRASKAPPATPEPVAEVEPVEVEPVEVEPVEVEPVEVEPVEVEPVEVEPVEVETVEVEPEYEASPARWETFEATRPDGQVVIVTRCIDTGEQTVSEK